VSGGGRGISRRELIGLTVVGVGAAALVALRIRSSQDDRAWLAGELTAAFPYLRFAPGTTEAFADDFVDNFGSPDREDLTPVADRFLRSTDFFLQGADEKREIAYETLYDPFVSPCFNPLATSLRH
jgi:hypothetical protein